MRSVDFKDLLRKLQELTPEQVTQVRLTLNHIAPGSAPTAAPARADEDWLLGGLRRYLVQRGLFSDMSPWPANAIKAYKARSEVATDWLERAAPGITLAGKRRLGFVVARSLASLVEEMNIDLNPTILCQQLHRVPEALDKSFPGYVRSGLLQVVLKGLNKDEVWGGSSADD